MSGSIPFTRRAGLRIAVIYAVFGALWILFSDRLLEFLVADPARVNALQTWKGWLYVAITAVLVYVLVRRFHGRVGRVEEKLSESERRLGSLLDATSEAVYVIDREGQCTYANASAARLLGFRRADALLGQDMHALLHHSRPDGSPYPASECPIHQSATRGASFQVDKEMFWRADGSAFPVEYRCDALMEDGAPAGSVVVFADISERRRMEQTLRQLHRVDAVGELTGGIAHHVNNMLTVILGNVRLAQRNLSADSAVCARLEQAVKAAQRGGEQVKRLLAFSRRQVLEPVAVDAGQLIHQAGPMLSTAARSGVEVNVESDCDVWLVRADPEQLTAALSNLVRNASDAIAETGTVDIGCSNVKLDEKFVSAHPGAKAGAYVCLTVRDDGDGMPADVAERAFEPFFTTREHGQAAGLGLSMVYGFIKQSGGYVDLDSVKGLGTSVRLYLPRWSGADPGQSERKARSTMPGGRETVLVVEDEEEVREVTAAQLEALGYRVLCACNGPQALARLTRDADVDLIVTDVVMPGGMNGMELVKAARRRDPNLRVLYSSGYASDILAGVVDVHGPVTLLNKPYTSEDLARRVRDALDEPAAHEAGGAA